MRTGFTITKNTFSLIAREFLNKGTLFVLLVLVGRFLGREALGRYSLAFAISQIFFFGTELGLNTLAIREVSKERTLAGKFLINIGFFRILSGIFTMLLIWFVTFALTARGETAAVIYLCGFSYFLVNITNLYTSIFRAFEKMELELAVALFKNAIFLPLAVLVLFRGLGLIVIFNIFLVANALALIVANFIFAKKIMWPLKWRLDFNFWKGQLLQTSPLWLSQLFGIAYLKLAPLLLFRLKGEEAVGLYNAGFVVVDGFWIMTGCFIYSLFPVISRLSGAEARREYLNGFKVLFSVFLILAGSFFLTARYIIPLLYGGKFLVAVPLFKTLVVAAVLVALDTHNGMTLIAMRRQGLLPFINGAGLALNFIFNLLFIPRFSYIGSAYALTLSETAVFVLMMAALRRFLLKGEAVAA